MLSSLGRCADHIGSSVLSRQQRARLNGKPFKLIKFRTMHDIVEWSGGPLPDSERLTDMGIRIHSSSLDKVPELWNVIKGDMNLVRPLPLLMEYLPLYPKDQSRRHEVGLG
ncbi:sugar transferase [Novosphingobium sp.]|uniref:sugar transferase n=1 Tax=Novosphingobium sp. TaxID=1874826 RepID=UPI00344CD3E4